MDTVLFCFLSNIIFEMVVDLWVEASYLKVLLKQELIANNNCVSERVQKCGWPELKNSHYHACHVCS